MRSLRVTAALLLMLLIPGCTTPDPAPTVEPTPTHPTRAEHPLVFSNGTRDAGDHWYKAEGRLKPGEGIWFDWILPELTDSWGASYELKVTCGRVLFVPPAELEFDEGDHHFAFEPDIRIEGEGTTGGGHGSGTSANNFAGGVSALVAEDETCISYKVTIPEELEAGTLNLTHFNATWSTHGPYTADEGAFTVPIPSAGWTHAHRVAACDTPVTSLAPSHLVTAALDFPNGVVLRAGPYLNGLFPGPTLDDAVFFGVWRDTPGDLKVDIQAPTPECLVVVATDFMPQWAKEKSGYVDRWWRQEPILP